MAKLKLRYSRSSGLVEVKAYPCMSSIRKSAAKKKIGVLTTPSITKPLQRKKANSYQNLQRLTLSKKTVQALPERIFYLIGGAKRDRTADLLSARQALSQLSYSPTSFQRP